MSLSYTTGNPANLTAGATASMNDIQGPFTDIKTWADAKFSASDLTTATLQTLGMNTGAQVGRGKSIIATSESRTNVAYGTLTTPDQVAGIVLPTDGLIHIMYKATWQESVNSAGRAAIFIGATQLKVPAVGGAGASASALQESFINNGSAAIDSVLSSSPMGLVCLVGANGQAYGGDVTTGQATGTVLAVNGALRTIVGSDQIALVTSYFTGNVCSVFAAAGTYTISVQYKSTSGSVTAKDRKLWVWSTGF